MLYQNQLYINKTKKWSGTVVGFHSIVGFISENGISPSPRQRDSRPSRGWRFSASHTVGRGG